MNKIKVLISGDSISWRRNTTVKYPKAYVSNPVLTPRHDSQIDNVEWEWKIDYEDASFIDGFKYPIKGDAPRGGYIHSVVDMFNIISVKNIQKEISDTVFGVKIINIGEHHSRNLVDCIDLYEKADPDIIHINTGLHDLQYINGKYRVPINEYRENMTELLNSLDDIADDVICATSTPIYDDLQDHKGFERKRFNKDVIDYNNVLREIGPVHDIYKHVMQNDMSAHLYGDGVHLSRFGEVSIGYKIVTEILKYVDGYDGTSELVMDSRLEFLKNRNRRWNDKLMGLI